MILSASSSNSLLKFYKIYEKTRNATETCIQAINGTYGSSGPISPSVPVCEHILEGIMEDLISMYALLRPIPGFYANNFYAVWMGHPCAQTCMMYV